LPPSSYEVVRHIGRVTATNVGSKHILRVPVATMADPERNDEVNKRNQNCLLLFKKPS